MSVCRDPDFILQTSHFEEIWNIGLHNSKDMTVVGDVGNIGSGMDGGRVIVKGDVREAVGQDKTGGTIIVEGDAGDVGTYHRAGEIIIKGDARGEIGFRMFGGTIRILGELGQISMDISGGSIYHRDRPIAVDGKWISDG